LPGFEVFDEHPIMNGAAMAAIEAFCINFLRDNTKGYSFIG
jgi:hypothetical protein